MKHLKHSFTDYLGISGSILCLVHCLAVPFMLLGREVMDHTEGSHPEDAHFSEAYGHVHQPLLQSLSFNWDHFFLLVALAAAWHTLRSSHRTEVKWMLVIGWISFFGGVVTFYPLVHVGSVLLIAGHLLNLYYCRNHCAVRT